MSTPPFQDWKLKLFRSYVQQVLAFPTTPVCFRHFYWHATCWLGSPKVGDLPNHIYNKIRSKVRPDLRPWCGPLVQLYEFGGPQPYHDPYGSPPSRDVRLLLVFPYLKEDIFEKAILRKWMDKVVIPAIETSLPTDVLQYFNHHSVKMIRLNSQAARVEGMRDVPDTYLDIYLRPHYLQSIWEEICRKTKTPEFEEFRGVSPVIFADLSPSVSYDVSPQEAFQKLLKRWSHNVDMQHIPRDGFYIDFVMESDIDTTEADIDTTEADIDTKEA
jgi:hypothetical protein